MTDAVECEYCGESFSPQGLPNHERHCQFDDSDRPGDTAGRSGVNNTDEDSAGRSESDGESPRQDDEEESVRNYTDVQKEALERDDRTCLECGHTDDVVVHTIWPDGKDQISNYLTLCPDCDEDYEQYRPLTKRTNAWYRGSQ